VRDTGEDGAADGGGAAAGSEEEVTKHQSGGKPCSEICMHLDFFVQQARLAVLVDVALCPFPTEVQNL
jgi:hypothetical protein